MENFHHVVQKKQLKSGTPEWAESFHSRWLETNRHIGSSREQLARFVTLNLAVILASLLLLPLVPAIADYGLAIGLVFGAAGLAVVCVVHQARVMIQAAVKERRL